MPKSQRPLEHLLSETPWMASLPDELAQRVLRETVTRKIAAQGLCAEKANRSTLGLV